MIPQVLEEESAPLLTPFQNLPPHQRSCRVLCSETDGGVLFRLPLFCFSLHTSYKVLEGYGSRKGSRHEKLGPLVSQHG